MDTNGYFLSPFSATFVAVFGDELQILFVSVFGDFCRQCLQALIRLAAVAYHHERQWLFLLNYTAGNRLARTVTDNSCSDVGSRLSFSGVLWTQDTLRDFYLLAVT